MGWNFLQIQNLFTTKHVEEMLENDIYPAVGSGAKFILLPSE